MDVSSRVFVFIAVFVLIFFLLFYTSARFRYYTLPIVYVGYVSLVATLYIPYAMLDPGNVINSVYICNICKQISKVIRIKWTIRGKEYLAIEEPCIYVANHQSYLDGLAMYEIWHIVKRCAPVTKKEMLYFTGPSGIVSWLCGLIFLDKSKSDKAKYKLNTTFEKLKEKKIKLFMYPEGTRRCTDEIHTFKKGAFHLAIDGQIPILPVVFSKYYFLDHQNKTYNGGKVITTALPPIPTVGYTKENINELIEKVHTLMNKTYKEVNEEIKKSLL